MIAAAGGDIVPDVLASITATGGHLDLRAGDCGCRKTVEERGRISNLGGRTLQEKIEKIQAGV